MHTGLAPERLDDGPEFATDTVCRALATENPHSSKVMGKMAGPIESAGTS